MSPLPFQPIAITGLSALFPQARSVDEFWRLILSGRDCMQEIPATHWLVEDYYDADPKAPGKTYSKHGAFLKDVQFDPVAYGLPPNVLPATDIAQLLALMLARQVLEDCSGGQIAKLKLDTTSVILGVASATEMISSMSGLLSQPMWIEGMRSAGIPEAQVQVAVERIAALFPEWNENTFPGCLGNVVAGRVANRFNLGGTNCVTDAACASSLAALHMGIGELQLHSSDRVITGGVDALNTIFMYMCFSKTPAMSPTGHCRPFADNADGTMMGEGGGMLVLRRLADAERDGDQIYAVIRGLGASSDGRSKSVYAPRPEGQTLSLQRCYALAGYAPDTVRLVEAHGTGTAAGDLCEATALKEVFAAADPERRQWCALGSVKSQIGHTKGAAGSAGLVKVALALRHQVYPPTANVDAPNPELGFGDSPLYLSTKVRPWIQATAEPRRGSVSSFGFGGTNFHVAVEEYRGAAKALRVRAFNAEVWLASAATASELADGVAAWRKTSEVDFELAARSSQQSFDAAAVCRAAIVATSAVDLIAKSAKLLERLQNPKPGGQPALDGVSYALAAPPAGAAGIVFLFPGQGSQSVGMAAELPMHFAPAMEVWEQLESLALLGAERLCDVVYPPPAVDAADAARQEKQLRSTENAQPALGTVSVAYMAVLAAAGVQPELTGGHSFGEIVALHAAGVLERADCLRLSRKRGELMAEVSRVHPGAMTAVVHPAEKLAALLTGELAGCVIANYNSPQQSVVAGPLLVIERLEAQLAKDKVVFRRLPVATAFHSVAVSPACEPLQKFLGGIKFGKPQLPVYNNTSAAPYSGDAKAMRATLAAQLAQPVQFAQQLQQMQAAGGRIFIEVGAGAVLTGLVRQTLGDAATAIALNPAGQPADVGLLSGLARLAVAGVPVNWDFLWDGYRAPVPEPKLSAAALPVGGYNIGRPYPPLAGGKTAPVLESAPALHLTQVSAAPAGAARVPAAPMAPVPAAVGAPLQTAAPARPAGGSDAVARAHETFMRTMSEAHRAFLETVGGARLPTVAPAAGTAAAAQAMAAAAQAMAAPAHAMAAPVHAMAAPPATPALARPLQAAPPALAPVIAAMPAAAAPPAAVSGSLFDSAKVIEIVLATVAEKTGYPREMLEPPMLLEADLGIDSIKRVEILSAVQKQLPGLPPVDAKVMGGLQTLAAISEYLVQALGAMPVAVPAALSPAAAVNGAHAAPSAGALSAAAVMPIVLQTVADKTGYPLEMLEPPMLLEADLGIDSIKRVEILSAVQKQLPGLPPVDAKVMGGLQTLQAISDYLAQQLNGHGAALPAAGPAALAAVAVAAPGAAFDGAAVLKIVLATVAEKTGYPPEMLEPAMLLEADLGIDSIKRVEILSAVQKQLPGLPPVDAKVMGGLQTLGAISDYLLAAFGAQAPAVPAAVNGTAAHAHAAAPAVQPAAAVFDVAGVMPIVLATVAEKTGYPVEMLEPGMLLEADLGIDSIKRVEILSAVQKKLPGLPPVDAKVMGGLQTLQAISDYLMQQLNGSVQPAAAVPAPAGAAPATAAPALPVLRYRLSAVPASAPGFALAGLQRAQHLFITDDGRGIATALAAALGARGIAATVGSSVPAACDGLILLDGLGADAGVDAACAAHSAAFGAARAAAAALQAAGGVFVTVQDTGGSYGLAAAPTARAWHGGFAGLAKSAAKEWPAVAVRSIDLECGKLRPQQLGQRLADELLEGGDERETGLPAAGGRVRLALTECAAEPAAKVRITAQTVVVASGGARGVTAAALLALAKAQQPKIALLGRTALAPEPAECAGLVEEGALRQALLTAEKNVGRQLAPKALAAAVRDILARREILETLAQLRAAGSVAEYWACDASDAASVQTVLAQVRKQLGPIRVLVHGAGVLADKLIAEKSDEQFARVFDTKVRGLQVLLQATAKDVLAALVLFSSVAGRFGNVGQADYAMANEVLNKVAQAEFARRGGKCLVRSINWGPWEGGMVTPALRAHFAAQGIGLIAHAAGAAAFVAELAGDATAADVEVVIGAGRLNLAATDPALPEHRAEIVVSTQRYPFLRDHMVHGKVVVPLALVVEWFCRAAALARPAAVLRALRDVAVMKAILIGDAEREQPLLLLTTRTRDAHTLELRISDAASGKPHFTALADFSTGETELLNGAVRKGGDWREFGFAPAGAYEGRLFHGSKLQVISKLGGWSPAAATLELANLPLAGGDATAWHVGPALLDGALQAAALWTLQAYGKSSLPLRIAELVLARAGRKGEKVFCQLAGYEQAGAGTVSDIDCVDAKGAPICLLRGVECFQVDSY
jgi:acyl transferase domain-containing protein/NADP-dependent 3-hydroxy acid dehydrogenase YdfG